VLSPHDVYPIGAGAPARSLLDVRAPVEVGRGALPFAKALPLMTDEERHLVGVRYADAGQEAALALGYELAGPHLPARTAAWRAAAAEAAAAGTPLAVACWRGGLRSRLVTEMIDRPDVDRVEGGYKALRALLSTDLPAQLARFETIVLTGLTGTGKTELLAALAGTPGLHALDLEGHAHHRGSAFGAEDRPQPAQATFENAVAAEVRLARSGLLVIEDESRYVGRRLLPDALHGAMAAAPLVVLEAPRAERVARIHDDYVVRPTSVHGGEAVAERLAYDVGRVRQRLGGGRTSEVLAALASAREAWDDPDAHTGWIGLLLDGYYDRLYARARERKERPVLAQADAEGLLAFLRSRAAERVTVG
jgi:tRNA 2-selenouridine synthase